MTHPITTAPADTARAMHADEMRGQDMQDEDECTDCEGSGVTHQTERYCTCAAGRELARYADDAPERIWIDSLGSIDTYDDGSGVIGYTRTDLCIAEAECQRRIDAAVLPLTDALTWIDKRCLNNLALRGLDNPNRSHAEAMHDAGECARAAIRARGQK